MTVDGKGGDNTPEKINTGDGLEKLFSDKLADTRQHDLDIAEAKMSWTDRRKHANERVSNPDNAAVKECRKKGSQLYDKLQGEVTMEDLPDGLELDDAQFQEAERQDINAVIKVLHEAADKIRNELFTDLESDKQTPEMGIRRRKLREQLEAIMATFLGMAEAGFLNKDYARAMAAFRAADLNFHDAEFEWFMKIMADALSRADMNDGDTRKALGSIDAIADLSLSIKASDSIKDKNEEELTSREKVFLYVAKARKLQEEHEQKLKEREEQERYEKKKEEGYLRVMRAAVADGKVKFAEHYERSSQTVRFQEGSEGSFLLNQLRELPKIIFTSPTPRRDPVVPLGMK